MEKAKASKPVNPPALLTLTPRVGAAVIASRFSVHKHPEGEGEFIAGLSDELASQCASVQNGDLARVESMLVSQAHSLDVLFTCLALKARENMGQYLDATDRYMRLALRAQSQCRATLETLAAIKNPPVVFAKQANIAHGHQQVNNGEANSGTRTRTIENQPSKLLEDAHGSTEWVDAGAAGTATAGDPEVATVGARNRSTDG